MGILFGYIGLIKPLPHERTLSPILRYLLRRRGVGIGMPDDLRDFELAEAMADYDAYGLTPAHERGRE